MERVTISVEDTFDFLHWESVKLDGVVIGFISRNKEVDLDYHFRALRVPQWAAHLDYEQKFCGYADSLIGAHNLAQVYANHLIQTKETLL
jgi:hypothetical protein